MLTLFGRHEVKLHLPLFLIPETIRFKARYIRDAKLEASCLKNIGRGNFTSCWPKRVKTKNYLKNTRPHLCPTCKILVQSVNWGLSYGQIHVVLGHRRIWSACISLDDIILVSFSFILFDAGIKLLFYTVQGSCECLCFELVTAALFIGACTLSEPGLWPLDSHHPQ